MKSIGALETPMVSLVQMRRVKEEFLKQHELHLRIHALQIEAQTYRDGFLERIMDSQE